MFYDLLISFYVLLLKKSDRAMNNLLDIVSFRCTVVQYFCLYKHVFTLLISFGVIQEFRNKYSRGEFLYFLNLFILIY